MLDNIVGLGLEIDFANLKSTPHLFLTVRGGGRVEFFSCTVWLGYSSSYWLKFSVLLSCPSLVLWLEREQAIGGNFFCLFSLVFLPCQLLHLSLQSRILEAKHKSRELTALWFLGVPASFADLPSLHLLESSYVCFVYNIRGF